MKYLTTLEVAHQLEISKQTLLNWLYAGKVGEPPRNRRGYRLWSSSRVNLIRRAIGEGRLLRRTVVHREGSSRPDVLEEFAREVLQFLGEAEIGVDALVSELRRLGAAVADPRKKGASETRRKKPRPRS